MTTLSSIERVLHLQRDAYEFLLWLGHRARTDDSILRDDNLDKWGYADSTQAWLRSFVGMMPAPLRPSDDDLPAFARLFSSFFSTSFEIRQDLLFRGQGGCEKRRSLVAKAPPGAKKKNREGARQLERLALESLALENELFPSSAELDALAQQAALSRELTLWTYFHELERRASFASQGAAVHQLWRELPERERRNLHAERVWQARETLLRALRLATESAP